MKRKNRFQKGDFVKLDGYDNEVFIIIRLILRSKLTFYSCISLKGKQYIVCGQSINLYKDINIEEKKLLQKYLLIEEL